MRRIIFSLVLFVFIFSCRKESYNDTQPVPANSLRTSDVMAVRLTPYSTGYNKPIEVTNAGDGRLFVGEQGGKIQVSDASGNKLSTPYLDISSKVLSGGFQGLLSFCLDPNYKTNGYSYIYYISPSYDIVIERYTVSSTDSNKANLSSALKILTIDYTANTEITGCVRFGTDGYLYISTADGNAGDGTQSKAQNKMSMAGKVLRIDVRNSTSANPYAVPADNPFVGNASYLPEIYALGFRVPWRFTVDAVTGNIYIGDVGQAQREEIDILQKGKNYGWPCYEGSAVFDLTNCNGVYKSPYYEYNHNSGGCCVIGGYVYRGKSQAGYGKYVYCDWCTGQFAALFNNGSLVNYPFLQGSAFSYVSFGEDYKHELYVVNQANNTIYKLTP